MSSKRALLVFLGFGVLPFLLLLNSGCDLVFELDAVENPQDNALYCDCSCEATAARNRMVVTSSDDAEEAASKSVDVSNRQLELGTNLVGLRFTNLTLPAGAEIAHAYVQFEGDRDGEAAPATYTIRAQASTAPATFVRADGNLSNRTTLASSVAWSPGTWANGVAGAEQRTADIGDLVQQLVDDPGWNDGSAIALLIEGSGLRTAESFDGDAPAAARLIIDLGVAAVLPVCAREGVAHNPVGDILHDDLVGECAQVASTLSGMALACGYPSPCQCSVVDRKDETGADQPDSVESDVCRVPCQEMVVDAPACNNFDPNAFTQCLADGGSKQSCLAHVSATNAAGGSPVCVHSGSALAFHAFGERSLCEVRGDVDITVDGRHPKGDPKGIGRLELLGEPCPGGTCPVYPFFDLAMNPVEFEVRWHSDPVFRDLSASGRGLDPALVDAGAAIFDPDAIFGTGLGRRGLRGLGIDAPNPEPLVIGVDWIGRTCTLDGALGVGVGDDGVCEADDTILCATDADCAPVGGACLIPPETAEMLIDLLVTGPIVNQPPSAAAGADQVVECTSSAGASFALDGSGSADPDRNLALATWHAGTRTGTELARSLVATTSLALGASQDYVLRLVDTFAQTDEDATSAAVVDTTPPDIACNAPLTMKPPDAQHVASFTATATDLCDDEVAAVVTSYDCFTFTKKNRLVSKLESCVVSFEDGTLRVANTGGYGDHVQWTVEATDDSGNVGRKTCEVLVAK